jgi:beta-N-acetylhexosaminidase
VSLFRARNVESPAQLRRLSGALQAARPAGDPPLLIAIDQEGGQLQAIGDPATAWPGALALAATGSTRLARQTGVAIGAELAALGVNVNFAPVCDLLDDPRNPVMGTRTFGDEPGLGSRLVAAFVRGIESTSVAATLKHFPGHGAVAADSHVSLPVLEIDVATLRSRELLPFRSGVAAGAHLAMPGHLAVPAVTGSRSRPATFAPEIVHGLLRDELGFRGVTVTDALDMGALTPFGRLPELAVLAAAAGNDLLLTAHAADDLDAAFEALAGALRSGAIDPAAARASAARVRRLRRWFDRPAAQPALSVVGSSEHLALAIETADRSVTRLRDRLRLLPLAAGRRLIVIAPPPTDLTPADTSSYLRLGPAEALGEAGFAIEDHVISMNPSTDEIQAILAAVAGRTGEGEGGGSAPAVVVGTIDALVHSGQAHLVEALVGAGLPVVAVALRTPVDLLAYPSIGTAIATYGSQEPSLRAMAAALAGRVPFRGRLPVRLAPRVP